MTNGNSYKKCPNCLEYYIDDFCENCGSISTIKQLCIGCKFNSELNFYKPCNTCINNSKNKNKKSILTKTQFGVFRKKLVNYYTSGGY